MNSHTHTVPGYHIGRMSELYARYFKPRCTIFRAQPCHEYARYEITMLPTGRKRHACRTHFIRWKRKQFAKL